MVRSKTNNAPMLLQPYGIGKQNIKFRAKLVEFPQQNS